MTEFKLKHNCCKECNFEWKSIDPLGKSVDVLVCKVCGREFIDEEFINRLKEKVKERKDFLNKNCSYEESIMEADEVIDILNRLLPIGK